MPRRELDVDDAAANSDRDRLRSILRAELVHDVFNVDLHRLLRDRKTLSNVTITVAFGHALENVDLPLGQGVAAEITPPGSPQSQSVGACAPSESCGLLR